MEENATAFYAMIHKRNIMDTCKWNVDEKGFATNPHNHVLVRESVRITDEGITEAFFPDDRCRVCNEKVEFIHLEAKTDVEFI